MGKKKFVLTVEILNAANDYIPLSEMSLLAEAIAPDCLKKSKTAKQNEKGLEFLSLPTMWVDDPEKKALYKMKILLDKYLKIQSPEDFTDKDYDKFGEAHILNQLERFKANTDLKDKVFNILGNLKQFEKMLNTEIENEKTVRNDPVARLTASIAIMSDPENIKKMKDELERTANDLQVAQKEVKAEIKGKGDES